MYSEIEMAVNPMKIVVVRGDRSAQPYFVCAATTFPPNPTIVWSKEIGTLQAKQAPVSHMYLHNLTQLEMCNESMYA